MSVTGSITTFYVDSTGVDLGKQLVEKDYLISVYPYLIPNFRNAGLFVWGDGTFGSLGNNTVTDKNSPVETVATGTNWKQVAGGEAFALAIKTDGTLWAWGRNNFGQLGNNSVVDISSPVQIGLNANWRNVACCLNSSFATKTDGTLWSWGYNHVGQLGDETLVNKSSPVQTKALGTNWLDVSGGQYHVAAIKTDGTLWCWGQGSSGRLGDNFAVNRSSPVQTIDSGTTWEQVSCGSTHTAAIKTDGSLWVWGGNVVGELGDNTQVNKSSPVQIGLEKTWQQVSAGESTTYAIKTDGSLWSWGFNFYGQLGDTTTNHKSSPIQVVGNNTNWNKVSAGKYFCSAIKTNGTLWSWGNNSNGELGDSTTANKSSPLQTSVGGQNWKTLGKLNSYCDSNYVIRDFDF